MEIIVKSLRDIKSLDKFFFLSLLVSAPITFFLGKFLEGDATRNQMLQFVIGTIVGTFLLLLVVNFFLRIWVKSRIEISRIPLDESYDGKVLLEIKNRNFGDKFTEVKVELLKFIPCDREGKYLEGSRDYAYLDIKRSDMTFKNGLSENGFTVDSDGGKVKVEIAENQDGVLRLLFDKVWEWDVLLSNEKDMDVYEHYGISFRVSGKITGFHFSNDFLYKIIHSINYRTVIISGKDGVEKTPSKVMWVLQPENG